VTGRWQNMLKGAITLRRDLHRRPELAWQEEETAATIRRELTQAGISWRPCAGTGTVASLAPEATGRHVALRADIDAMPITEGTMAPWSSQREGVMHACGHDGHTASLFAAAWWLKHHEDQLPGPVSLLFQPAEEGGHGAKRMIEDGALEGVDAIFGWHNWPAIRFGRAICPDGAVMAANGTFHIEVTGRGGHASQPEECRDPVLAASAITVALQQVVSRRMPAQRAAVVSVTNMEAPSVETVIPDRAYISGSIRISSTAHRDSVEEMITVVAQSTARAYGVNADVEVRPRYGATVNHSEQAAELRTALEEELGPSWNSESTLVPVMASEDFSYYLAHVPGAFAMLGADDGNGHAYPCHSSRYDFNDGLIPHVARVFARVAGAPVPPPDNVT
jgi:amidohydrolase